MAVGLILEEISKALVEDGGWRSSGGWQLFRPNQETPQHQKPRNREIMDISARKTLHFTMSRESAQGSPDRQKPIIWNAGTLGERCDLDGNTKSFAWHRERAFSGADQNESSDSRFTPLRTAHTGE